MIRKCFAMFVLLLIACAAQAEEKQYEFAGVHFLASYNGCDLDALTDLERLPEVMLTAAKASGATVLNAVQHIFPPDGFTMAILLSESHASIHTYPEHGACFIDLFTCGNSCSAERFDLALREYLKPSSVNARRLIRHEAIED